MIWRNTVERYGAIAKSLHLIVAVLILTTLGIGLVMANISMGPEKFRLFFWHKSFGMTVLAFVILRVLWRLSSVIPRSLPTHAKWERTLAHIVHFLLYVAMVTIPLTGWLMSSAKAVKVSVFGWFTLPDLVGPNKAVGHWLAVYHVYTAYTLIGLIVLHVAGALKHFVIDRDNTVARMIPFVPMKQSGSEELVK